MSRIRMLMVFAAMFALLGAAFAACGGDDDDGGSNPLQGDSGDSGDGEGDSSDEAFEDAVKDLSDKTFYVKYEGKFEGTSQTMVFAQKPGKSYLEQQTEGESKFIAIDDGKNAYLCFGEGDTGQCTKSASTGSGSGLVGFDVGALAKAAAESGEAKEIDGKKIAGRDARCFEAKDQEEEGTVCIDKKDGFMLSIESEDGQDNIVAKEVKTSVDDKLFEPPYDVVGG